MWYVHREKQFSIQIINQVWTKCINYGGHGARMAQKCERGVQPHGSKSITLPVYIYPREAIISLFLIQFGAKSWASAEFFDARPQTGLSAVQQKPGNYLFYLYTKKTNEISVVFAFRAAAAAARVQRFIDVLPSAHACWSFLCAQHREILPDRPLCWQTCINFLLKKSATHNYCAVSLFLAFLFLSFSLGRPSWTIGHFEPIKCFTLILRSHFISLTCGARKLDKILTRADGGQCRAKIFAVEVNEGFPLIKTLWEAAWGRFSSFVWVTLWLWLVT